MFDEPVEDVEHERCFEGNRTEMRDGEEREIETNLRAPPPAEPDPKLVPGWIRGYRTWGSLWPVSSQSRWSGRMRRDERGGQLMLPSRRKEGREGRVRAHLHTSCDLLVHLLLHLLYETLKITLLLLPLLLLGLLGGVSSRSCSLDGSSSVDSSSSSSSCSVRVSDDVRSDGFLLG